MPRNLYGGIAIVAVTLLAVWTLGSNNASEAAELEPIRALLVTGGCCHDYDTQKSSIPEGISERVDAPIDWTIVHEGGEGRDHKLSVFRETGWSDDYDIVVHNTCFGDVNDAAFIEAFVEEHGNSGTAAMFIHCAMHSYRHQDETDAYRELVGVRSMAHEGHRPLAVENLAADHPIMAEFPETWQTPNGELYMIEKVWPNVTPLAQAYGEDTQKDHLVAWTNTYGNARVFGTTLGHHNETVEHPVYMDMLSRGFRWTLGRLD